MQKIFHFAGGRVGVGLLILRFVVGMGLMSHGWFKIQKPFAWMGGGGAPGFLQALAAVSEFCGGLAIVLGFLTPLAALGVLCTMIGAWYFANRGNPWLSLNPKAKTFELAALYGSLAITLIFTGPGLFSLDALIWNRKKR